MEPHYSFFAFTVPVKLVYFDPLFRYPDQISHPLHFLVFHLLHLEFFINNVSHFFRLPLLLTQIDHLFLYSVLIYLYCQLTKPQSPSAHLNMLSLRRDGANHINLAGVSSAKAIL